MPTPADVVWDADPHTLAKHRLLQAYLAAWLPTLLHGGYDRVTYAEGFAGPGIYRGGEPGSPVAALRAFLGQRRLLAGGRTVDMVLAEKDHRRMTELRRQMGRALTEAPVAPAGISVEYVCGDHAKVLLPALERIGAMRRPVFAFLDSYGGPDVPLDVARRIGGAPASEVLVTFGTSFFIRFCEVEGHQAEGDRVFGGPQWRQVAKLAPREKKPFLVATYRRSLRQAGFRFVLSFEMLDEQGHDLHLVFGTTHRAGLEKMKDAMWAIDPIGGVRFRDPRDPSQGMLDFTINPDFGPLRRSLLAELSHGPQPLALLKEHTLVETVYRPPHARTVVQELLRQGAVQRDPERGHLTDATVIRLAEPTTAGQAAQPELPF
jgi:three-Cys-motif partner protein